MLGEYSEQFTYAMNNVSRLSEVQQSPTASNKKKNNVYTYAFKATVRFHFRLRLGLQLGYHLKLKDIPYLPSYKTTRHTR